MNLWLMAGWLILAANPFNDTFDRASQAYESGDYASAAQLYAQLAEEGVVHPAVFYNLGNAHFRQGQLAAAIVNYERALQLEPGFESAEHNLAQCLQHTQRQLARPLAPQWEQSLLFWHYRLSARATRWIALTLWIAFWAVMALRRWRRVRFTRQAVIVLGVMAVAFWSSVYVKAHPRGLAVAARPSVPVLYGASEDATMHFELYEGDRVGVERRLPDWALVVTADGKRGWARQEQLYFVGPPYEMAQSPAEVREAELSS